MKPSIKVSKKEIKKINYINEVIQEFFETYLEYTETRYFIWKDKPNKAGEMMSFIIRAIRNRPW